MQTNLRLVALKYTRLIGSFCYVTCTVRKLLQDIHRTRGCLRVMGRWKWSRARLPIDHWPLRPTSLLCSAAGNSNGNKRTVVRSLWNWKAALKNPFVVLFGAQRNRIHSLNIQILSVPISNIQMSCNWTWIELVCYWIASIFIPISIVLIHLIVQMSSNWNWNGLLLDCIDFSTNLNLFN